MTHTKVVLFHCELKIKNPFREMCEKSPNILHNICYLDNPTSTSALPNFIDKGSKWSQITSNLIFFLSRDEQV